MAWVSEQADRTTMGVDVGADRKVGCGEWSVGVAKKNGTVGVNKEQHNVGAEKGAARGVVNEGQWV